MPAVAQNLSHKYQPHISHLDQFGRFKNISNTQEFAYYVEVIQRWVYFNRPVNIATKILLEYCESFNKLMINCTNIHIDPCHFHYIEGTLDAFAEIDRIADPSSPQLTLAKILSDLKNNLKFLHSVQYVKAVEFEVMMRAHCALIQDAKIESEQSIINDFKDALWPLYKRANFELRFTRLRD